MHGLRLDRAVAPDDVALVRTLMLEYAQSLGVNLGYQGFEEELRDLPGPYAPPQGVLFLAWHDTEAIGCVGVRPAGERIAELKRLYVRTSGRGLGAGRALTVAALAFARDAGYASLRLDTLPQMEQAQALYRSLGFREIDAYRYSPVPGTRFMEITLADPGEHP
jgi:ribosomal protein S18 acetylase RimI-like enzyme